MDLVLEEDAVTFPMIESDLMITLLSASDFKTQRSAQDRVVFSDTLPLNLVTPEFLMEQLKKTNLTFQFTNTLDTNFKIDFEFLNQEDELIYTVQVPISAGSTDAPIKVETIVFIEAPEIEILKVATKLVCKITLSQNEKPVALDANGFIALRSKKILFFE